MTRTHLQRLLTAAAAATIATAAAAQDTASHSIDVQATITSDVRNRGISDSMRGPGAKLSLQAAHESGLTGLLELFSVSKKQFLDGAGVGVVAGVGYRWGNPDGWHFGVGAATERFPGASFEAPHAFDLETFTPLDVRRTRYDSDFVALEAGYGALETRVLSIVSKTYRGADTGGVCGTLLALGTDPTPGLDCYARGDHNSRGTWLADVNYRIDLDPRTALTLHAGLQKVRNFREADTRDLSVSLRHRRWGFDWTAEWVSPRTRARELYLVQDGSRLRATDNDRLVLSLARKF
ncbi:hypothetical protein LOC51_14280 [Rubrivivax sp. JA1024]|nr:hypothetical protein [Rubrivivax sp. JA1024]